MPVNATIGAEPPPRRGDGNVIRLTSAAGAANLLGSASCGWVGQPTLPDVVSFDDVLGVLPQPGVQAGSVVSYTAVAGVDGS